MEPKSEQQEEEYDIVTICFDTDGQPVIVPGRVSVGTDIRYEDSERRATAERQVNLPLRMDRHMMEEWINEQMSREGSMLREKVERAKEDGR